MRSDVTEELKLPELEEGPGPASGSMDELTRGNIRTIGTIGNVIRKSHAHHHRELLIIDER